jgi:site-specific recombinase XerC
VFLPEALVPKLARFWSYKRARNESTTPLAPVFCGLSRRRISTRRVQVLFHEWQERAGFGRHYPFHGLRHSSVTKESSMTRL